MKQLTKLTFPSEESYFPHFYRQLAEVMEQLYLPEAERFRFMLCVSEAYTNAFLHGNKKNPEKKIYISFYQGQQLLQVDVEDEGEGKVEEINIRFREPNVIPTAVSGRGVGIIKKYADSINVAKREEGGIRFTMFWKIKTNDSDRQNANAISRRG